MGDKEINIESEKMKLKYSFQNSISDINNNLSKINMSDSNWYLNNELNKEMSVDIIIK